ncbi:MULTISPECIES: acyl-CoA dehydrogenase [Pseudomonas]|uniref:Acyl-CoA dehydrogenase n=2 Tax=Pseudomonas TaxID=286 RepID=A0A2Z4RFV8_PSEPU|nr:acyl-CoA dehydrogenase [Pseudomonas putida]BCX67880.1 acyl-CoA dehydrogenase [Pseudomonas izuensis]
MGVIADQSLSAMLRQSADDFLTGSHSPSRLRGWIGRARPVESSLWHDIAALGWTGLLLPEALGGSGLGLREATVLCEVMGERLFAEPFVGCCVMPSLLLTQAENGPATEQLAAWQVSGERLLALAWQEQAGQMDPDLIECRVDQGRLSGRKVFVLGAEQQSVLLVSALEHGQPVIVAVAANAPGVRVEAFAAGIGAQYHVDFDQAPVLFEQALLRGQPALNALQLSLAGGRIALSAELAGQAAGCLQQTLDFVSQRVQFERPLGTFQSIQHRCVDLSIEQTLAKASLQHALTCHEQAPLTQASQAAISAAKARCAQAAILTGKQAVQLHGAMGFAEEVDIGLYLRAAMFGSAWLGAVWDHRRQFAKLTDENPIEATLAPFEASSSSDPREWSDEEFRARLRVWLTEFYPEHLRQNDRRPFLRLRGDDLTGWLRLLNDHGWRAPAWPREYGGMGISFRKQLIYQQEMERAGVGRIIDNGETQLGPTIIKGGTEEQRARILPRILACDDMWCQGYSEPGAGSDLASLRTRADLDGDEFVVNGQKIWTTHAAECSHIYALVRTGKFEKKQQGISFLLIDLSAPGVSVRPIANIAGEDEFCEVFFDNVRVPASNLLGELHQGWSLAKALLGHERIWLGSAAMAGSALELAGRLVTELGLANDRGVLDRLACLQADLHDYRLFYAQICDRIAEADEQPGPEVSMLKVYISELLQRITEFCAEIAGDFGGIVGDVQIGSLLTDLHWPLMMARPVSIYAGANEVQRDILAKAVLKLPSAPRT